MAVENVDEQGKARIVFGLNANAVLDEVKSNASAGKQARTNTGFYITLTIVIVLIIAIITVLVVVWRRRYMANRFLSELRDKKLDN